MPTINDKDDYAGTPSDGLVTPAIRGVAHTSSATAFKPTRAIHANNDETLVVDFLGGATGVTLEVKAGQVYPYRLTKATTATGIVLLY